MMAPSLASQTLTISFSLKLHSQAIPGHATGKDDASACGLWPLLKAQPPV